MKRRLSRLLEGLHDYPRPRGVRALRGGERLSRLRVGAYRVVYTIDDSTRLVRLQPGNPEYADNLAAADASAERFADAATAARTAMEAARAAGRDVSS